MTSTELKSPLRAQFVAAGSRRGRGRRQAQRRAMERGLVGGLRPKMCLSERTERSYTTTCPARPSTGAICACMRLRNAKVWNV